MAPHLKRENFSHGTYITRKASALRTGREKLDSTPSIPLDEDPQIREAYDERKLK
jgi:hypothetical protein